MFTKSIALDLIGDNIRVNCICPGIAQTPLLDAEIALSADAEATRAEFAEWAPIGRNGRPRRAGPRHPFSWPARTVRLPSAPRLLLDGGYTAT